VGWLRDFAFLCVSRFGIFFAMHELQPLFPGYLKGMGASSTIIGAVMGAFTIAATFGRVPVGMLIDRFRRLRFLFSGMLLIGISTLAYTWAPSIFLIALLRMLQGVGWAGFTTAVNTLAADIAPSNRRGEMIGYAAVASNIAAALGPLGGFGVFARFGYEGLFLSSFGIVLLSLFIASWMREPELPVAQPGRRQGWIELIVVRESLLPAVTVIFLSFCHGSVISFVPLYALERGVNNPSLFFTLLAVSMMVVRPIAGPISDKISRRAVIVPGYLFYLAGILVLALAPSSGFLWTAAILIGLGLGAAFPTLMALAVDSAQPQRRGHSLAQFSLFFDLGMGLGSVTLGALLDHTDQNYPLMYLVGMAVAVLGLVLYEARNR
jgi:MFS family permease